MDQLAELRLVRRRDEADGDVGYELAHESLARHWDVLKQWISERAVEDALLADLEMEAKLWARQGRPSDRLRPKLEIAEGARKRLGPEALAYVDASMVAARAAMIAALAARRSRVAAMTAVVLVVVGAVVVYVVQITSKEAETRAALEDAERERDNAKNARNDAVKAETKASAAAENEKQAKIAADIARVDIDLTYRELDLRIRGARTLEDLEQIQADLAKKRDEATDETVTPPDGPTSLGQLDEAELRKGIEDKVWSGEANEQEIKLLIAICKRQRDLACKNRAFGILLERPAAETAASAPTSSEPGFLTIVCNPFCDEVIDNGRSLGPSPIVHLRVDPGSHKITVKKGAMKKAVSVIVVSGQVTAQRLNMKE